MAAEQGATLYTRLADEEKACAQMSMKEVLASVFRKKRPELIEDVYRFGRKLGAGQFGTVYECQEKATGNMACCKAIPKSKLVCVDDVADVRREVAILHHLGGHEHIVEILGAFEDKANVYIVMELCNGGDLYDNIIERMEESGGTPYSERDAARVLKSILSVVEICHSSGVIHRDLKPENFLISKRGPEGVLKATDFGLSSFYKPESQSSRDIFKAILSAPPSFSLPPWPSISKEAKQLVTWMLQSDPKKRPLAHQVLCHSWVNEPGVAPQDPLPPLVVSRLKEFSSMAKMKRVATHFIVSTLGAEEVAGLREMFETFDADGSGTITLAELGVGLRNMGANVSESDVEAILRETDIDHSGQIEFAEFLAATLHLSKIEKGENLKKAFAHFDTDGSGFITAEELQQACKELRLDPNEVEAMLDEVDENHDGKIDYTEFVSMMRKKGGGRDGRTVDLLQHEEHDAGLLQLHLMSQHSVGEWDRIASTSAASVGGKEEERPAF